MSENAATLLQNTLQLTKLGKFHDALNSVKTLLEQFPTLVEAWMLRAQIEQRMTRFDDARHSLLKAIEFPGQNSQQLFELAKICNQFELYFPLEKVLRRLQAIEPNNLNHVFHLSLCLAKTGQIAESVDLARRCETEQFAHPMLDINLGHGFKALGESVKASQYYQRFIKNQPSMSGTGFWSLADLKDYHFTQDDIQKMLFAMDSPLQADQKAMLAFALGRAHEQTQLFEQAFQFYAQANAILASKRAFNGPGFANWSASLIVQKDFQQASASPDEIPIFIVGMPRSGTTLTEQILASHSQVECTDELPFLERIAIQLSQGGRYPDAIATMSIQDQERFRQFYLEQAREYCGAHCDYFIDKNPTNFTHIGLIRTLFPEAKIVALVRDPIDNTMSVFKQHFAKGNDFSYSIDSIINYTESYYRLIDHWAKAAPLNLHVLHYNKLVNDSENEIRQLLSFCDLDFESQCLTFHKSKRAVLTPSVSQVRQPINNRSVQSGYQYADALQSHWDKLSKLKSMMPR